MRSCAGTAAEAPRPGLAARGRRGGVLRHGAMFSRPARQGDNTGVDALCTYRKEPSAPPLDRVGLYHEVSSKTRGITQLGPYSLDRDSLYVNGDLCSSLCLLCCPAAPFPSRSPAPAHHPLSLSFSLSPGYNEQPALPSEYLAGAGWAQKAASASRGSSRAQRRLGARARDPWEKRGACQPSPSRPGPQKRGGWQETSASVHPEP